MILRKTKVGVVQATPALFDKDATVDIVCRWIEKGAQEGCEFILFPESFIPCYPRGLTFEAVIGKRTERAREIWLDYWENSVDLSQDDLKRIQTTIKTTGVKVALGITERQTHSLMCSLVYFNDDGSIMGVHRKIKPTALERFIWGEGDGSTLQTLSTNIGVIGGLICWENYMPLARMAMYNKGVEVYLAPTADARPSWQGAMQHIALEGRCFVLASNQFVKRSDYPERYQDEIAGEPDVMCPGGSVIYSPMGEVLAGPLWHREGLLTAEIDQQQIIKSKLDFDCNGHYSRPDIFNFSTNKQPETLKIV